MQIKGLKKNQVINQRNKTTFRVERKKKKERSKERDREKKKEMRVRAGITPRHAFKSNWNRFWP